jgi:hypothetical protein
LQTPHPDPPPQGGRGKSELILPARGEGKIRIELEARPAECCAELQRVGDVSLVAVGDQLRWSVETDRGWHSRIEGPRGPSFGQPVRRSARAGHDDRHDFEGGEARTADGGLLFERGRSGGYGR